MVTPEYLMKMLRRHRGLKEDDISKDKIIEMTSALGKLRDLCGWKLGDPEWAECFIEWAEGCGMKITNKRKKGKR